MVVTIRLLSGETFDVAYKADMLAYEYLNNIIIPALPSGVISIDDARVSTRGVLVRYVEALPGGNHEFQFDYANRLKRVGDFMPPDANILVLQRWTDRDNAMLGNLVKEDVRADCAICFEGGTDFTLECGHRFHSLCALRCPTYACPFCRKSYPAGDIIGLHKTFFRGVQDGRYAIE